MLEQALIDRIVARVLALLSGNEVDGSRRNVLMLFSGASTGFVVGMEAIRRLTSADHDLTVVMTPAAYQIITPEQVKRAGAARIVGPGEWTDAPGLVKQTDLVLIPTMSMNLSARLALGLMDSLITTLALGSLLAGKAVVAIKDGADPNGNAGLVFGATETMAPVLRTTLAGHLTTLASYGIELVDESDFLLTVERRLLVKAGAPQVIQDNWAGTEQSQKNLPATAAGPSRLKTTFVTTGDLQALPVGGTLRLANGSRLTPQAHDAARRLNLQLVLE
jgi:hypothetical protein